MPTDAAPVRCGWTGDDPQMIAYHDAEWGVPLHDDGRLFEFLVLEGMQAGLSWRTILHKRENFRRAFDGFDPARVAAYGAADVEARMLDAGIVRNRQKIEAAVNNARRFLEVQAEFGTFDAYIWRFVDGRPIRNAFRSLAELPATSPASDALSRDLKRCGFKFVGSTVCYAHMQATGMVNDHVVDCFRYRAVG
ncbi:DNA-3-methyladenine glycosylase I [bacterium]|nr:DNA-3-methyladenine glycosylase I [Chloroflexi bacterium CFX6]RIL11473.1 MAG: DNA-3-methyladenine glycosylase I [bacterium]